MKTFIFCMAFGLLDVISPVGCSHHSDNPPSPQYPTEAEQTEQDTPSTAKASPALTHHQDASQ